MKPPNWDAIKEFAFAALGILGVSWLLVHSGLVDEKELDAYAKKKAGIIKRDEQSKWLPGGIDKEGLARAQAEERKRQENAQRFRRTYLDPSDEARARRARNFLERQRAGMDTTPRNLDGTPIFLGPLDLRRDPDSVSPQPSPTNSPSAAPE